MFSVTAIFGTVILLGWSLFALRFHGYGLTPFYALIVILAPIQERFHGYIKPLPGGAGTVDVSSTAMFPATFILFYLIYRGRGLLEARRCLLAIFLSNFVYGLLLVVLGFALEGFSGGEEVAGRGAVANAVSDERAPYTHISLGVRGD